MTDTTIHYWLATSAVRFTGSRITTKPRHGGSETHTADAQAALVLRADHRAGPLPLKITTGLLENDKFSLTFTDDGRLSGSDITNVGQGSVVLGAIASLAGQAIGGLTGVRAAGAGVAAASAKQETENTEDAATPASTADAFPEQVLLDELVVRENDLARELLVTAGAAHLAAIGAALDLVAAQRDRLETAKAAWAAGSVTHCEFDWTLDLSELPTEQELRGTLDAARYPAAHEIWTQLGIMATVDSYRADQDLDSPLGCSTDELRRNDDDRQAWYRLPRAATVTVWTADLDDAALAPAPVRSSTVTVLDRHCRNLPLPIAEHGIFGMHETSVAIGTLGTPVALGADVHSAIADALSSQAAVTGGVVGGLADVAKVRAGVAALEPAAPPSEIDKLTIEKQTLELQAAIAKLKKSG